MQAVEKVVEVKACSENPNNFKEIPCVIEGGENISCRQEGSEVFVPFSFLRDHYEVHGSLQTGSRYSNEEEALQGDVFVWQHTNSKVCPKKKKNVL